MRAVVQRVTNAAVTVRDDDASAPRAVGSIARGLLVYLGVGGDDSKDDVSYVAAKLAGLRIFQDGEGKMNASVQDIAGGVLVVSQFTLFGDVRGGRRPSFVSAAAPEHALALYEALIAELRERFALGVATGEFRANMTVSAAVDGPVTILVDSKKQF